MRCPPKRSAREPKKGCGNDVLTANPPAKTASSDGLSWKRPAMEGRSAGSMLVTVSFAR